MKHTEAIRILLIKDDGCDVESIRTWLANSVYKKSDFSAVSIQEGVIQTLKARTPHLVFLDISLMPGGQVLAQLRAIRKTAPTLPIIVFTASEDQPWAKKAIRQGAQDCLLKSDLNSRNLMRSITFSLERSKLRNCLLETLENIKILKGLLPICTHCKKIRDNNGFWDNVESFIGKCTDAEFTHGFCPECLQHEIKKLEQYRSKV